MQIPGPFHGVGAPPAANTLSPSCTPGSTVSWGEGVSWARRGREHPTPSPAAPPCVLHPRPRLPVSASLRGLCPAESGRLAKPLCLYACLSVSHSSSLSLFSLCAWVCSVPLQAQSPSLWLLSASPFRHLLSLSVSPAPGVSLGLPCLFPLISVSVSGIWSLPLSPLAPGSQLALLLHTFVSTPNGGSPGGRPRPQSGLPEKARNPTNSLLQPSFLPSSLLALPHPSLRTELLSPASVLAS